MRDSNPQNERNRSHLKTRSLIFCILNLFFKLPTTGTTSDESPTYDEKELNGKGYRTLICTPKGLKGLPNVKVIAVDDKEVASMSDTFASEDVK